MDHFHDKTQISKMWVTCRRQLELLDDKTDRIYLKIIFPERKIQISKRTCYDFYRN